jgi:hypothetical protein
MSSRSDELLTDQQLEDAATDQIEDLVNRIDKILQSRGSEESCAVNPMVYPSRPIPQSRTRPSIAGVPINIMGTSWATEGSL